MVVVREELEDRAVGRLDVLGVTGERRPPERAEALLELRADVGGHEAGEVERALAAAELGLAAQGVAVVEDLGAAVEEAEHADRRPPGLTRCCDRGNCHRTARFHSGG